MCVALLVLGTLLVFFWSLSRLSTAMLRQVGDTLPRPKTRVLQIVTSYRLIEKGNPSSSRLRSKVLPGLVPGLHSLLSPPSPYFVDVHFVLGYEMSVADREYVASLLPPGVGVSYSRPDLVHADGESGEPREHGMLLARYHRDVVKENLEDYDLFVCFEDDMSVGRGVVDNYLELSRQIDDLKRAAPEGEGSYGDCDKEGGNIGEISREQYERMVPGFMRAEVAHAKVKDSDVEEGIKCCDIKRQEVVMWESSPVTFRLREVEGLGAPGQPVGFLPVALQSFDKDVGATRVAPRPKTNGDASVFSIGAGWMATQEQVKRFEKLCDKHGFLPPFRGFNELKANQEFWLGGFQMYNERSGCALQRVVRMDAEGFEKSLVYHISNNKQAAIDEARIWSAEGLRWEVVKRWKKGATEGKEALVRTKQTT